MMDYLVDGCGAFSAAYLDDLVVLNGSWEDHLGHLLKFLTVYVELDLQQSQVNVNLRCGSVCTWDMLWAMV